MVSTGHYHRIEKKLRRSHNLKSRFLPLFIYLGHNIIQWEPGVTSLRYTKAWVETSENGQQTGPPKEKAV